MNDLSVAARDALFAPLDAAGRVEAVARRISDGIGLGIIADGDQLPPESELATQLAVSSMTLREALAILREQGLVETRRGRSGGTFVCSPSDDSAGPLRAQLRSVTSDELRDLEDMHRAVAGTAALLAADRASPDQVERLRAHVRDLSGSTNHGDRRRADGRFHIEVAASAQSPRLTNQEIAIQSEIGALLWLPGSEAMAQKTAVEQHGAIIDAIVSSDGELARRLAERHVALEMSRLLELHLRLQCAG